MVTNGRFGQIIKVISDPAYVTKDRNSVLQPGGTFGKVMRQLARSLHLSYIIILPESDEYGTLLPNGSVTGVTGMLHNQEADLLADPYTITYARSQVVDFFQVLDTSPLVILSSSLQSTQNVDFTNTVMRFGWKIWVAYFVSMGITCLLFIIVDALKASKFRNTEFSRKLLNISQGNGSTILKKENNCRYFWELLRIFMNQGSSDFVMTLPKRTMLMCFILLTFFFNVYFGCDLHTEAVSDTTANIDSLEELIERSNICPLMRKGIIERMILSGKGSVYDGIRERVRSCPGSLILDAEVQAESTNKKIASRKFAFIDADDAVVSLGANLCKKYPSAKLHISKESIVTIQMSMAAGKHVKPELKQAITRVLGRILSSGIMLKWLADSEDPLPPCLLSESQDNEDTLSLGDLESLKNMFLMWISGISLSVVTFLFEVLIHIIERRGKRMKTVSPQDETMKNIFSMKEDCPP